MLHFAKCTAIAIHSSASITSCCNTLSVTTPSPGRHTWVITSSSSLLSSKYLCYLFHFYSVCRVQQHIQSLPSPVLVRLTLETSHSIIGTTCWSPQLPIAAQGKQRPPSVPFVLICNQLLCKSCSCSSPPHLLCLSLSILHCRGLLVSYSLGSFSSVRKV